MRAAAACRPLRRAAAGALLLLAVAAPPLPGSSASREDASPSDAAMTGSDIYKRVIKNRFRSFAQDVTLTSGDRGGNEQHSRLQMKWQNTRNEDDSPSEGYLSKAVITYVDPFDLRYTGYLMLQREAPPNDQFVYSPSRRKVRRVNLRAETVFGTDFSFEDIIPREFDSATYQRRPDELLDGAACFVVEATPKPEENSLYSKFLLYIDKQRNVPLRVRYWDAAGLEIKELVSPASSVKEFDGVFVPMQATMRSLQQDSYSHAKIDKLEPNPILPASTFDPRRLESH
jgi:hypothetical protein